MLISIVLRVQSQDSIQKIKWYKRPAFTIPTAPILLTGYGLAVFDKRELITSSYKVREYRNTHYANFHTRVDDYLLYACPATSLTIRLCGGKTKNDFKNQLINYGASLLLANAIVQPLKYGIKTLRPDGSSKNSFPSGHTTAAFVGAELFHQEMKDMGWGYSVAGYTVASAVGCMRILNNRHWFSDVLVGAATGILSTKLIYFGREKLKGRKKRKTPPN
jgi:membrane-associated phospholipid phosphatase